MPIEIDVSQVPVAKRTDPRFLELKSQMQAALDNPKWRAAFAIHEAGHKIYISRFGVTEFEYIKPHIEYHEGRNDFDGFPASVKAGSVPSIPGEGFDFGKWLVQMAQSQAAGGVFARRLTAAPDQGEEQDRQNFKAACDQVRTRLRESNVDEDAIQKIDDDAIWKQAQTEILKELNSPKFRQECWSEAKKIETELFG